jgi:hypothetical protein
MKYKNATKKSLSYIRISKRLFAYYKGNTYYAVKECRVKYLSVDVVPIPSFICQIQVGLDERYGLRIEICKRIDSSKTISCPVPNVEDS